MLHPYVSSYSNLHSPSLLIMLISLRRVLLCVSDSLKEENNKRGRLIQFHIFQHYLRPKKKITLSTFTIVDERCQLESGADARASLFRIRFFESN